MSADGRCRELCSYFLSLCPLLSTSLYLSLYMSPIILALPFTPDFPLYILLLTFPSAHFLDSLPSFLHLALKFYVAISPTLLFCPKFTLPSISNASIIFLPSTSFSVVVTSCLTFHLSITIYLLIYPSIHLSIYISLYLSICLFIRLSHTHRICILPWAFLTST